MKSRHPRLPAREIIAAAAAAKARRAARTATSAQEPGQAAPEDVPVQGQRRYRLLVWLLLAFGLIAATGWAAAALPVSGGLRWTLAGTAAAGAVCLLIAFLMGPVARRLAGEHRPLTTAEHAQMTAHERVEAVNNARHTIIQAVTGLLLIAGLVFTGQGLVYTAQTVEAARQEQAIAREGQIADRYTKAIEQLGSAKPDVRLGGIYALQRLATDSDRDQASIRNVLAAFVRNHDVCTLQAGQKTLPKHCTVTTAAGLDAIPAMRLGADVRAALTVASLTTRSPDGVLRGRPDLSGTRFPRAYIPAAFLRDVDLHGADLRGVVLKEANLSNANLSQAILYDADLLDADLSGADLSGANLHDTNLIRADLRGAVLFTAHLGDADLLGADLTGADLTDADLRGANLQEVKGWTADQIRKVASTNAETLFGVNTAVG